MHTHTHYIYLILISFVCINYDDAYEIIIATSKKTNINSELVLFSLHLNSFQSVSLNKSITTTILFR